jgi:type I restriction enzyme S subunit
LAVRGKLTRREAGDESAKELLKCISEQKEKSVIPIKEREAPFELPDGWVWTSLNDISRLITDGTHVTPSYLYDGVPFLSVKDVSKGYLDFSNTRFISEEEHKKLSARCKPELGDVLLTKVGTTGIALVVDTDREFSIFVSIALLKIFQNEVLPNYLSLVINSPFVKRQSDKYTMGVGNKNLVLKHIKNFLIPLPPVAEQERIVKRVEQLLSLCDALEARLQSAEEERGRLVRAVMAKVGTAVES